MYQGETNHIVCCLIASAALVACGGAVTVGGTLSGLRSGTSVVLQNNGADNLTLTNNGPFTFATGVAEAQTYNVTVLTQPLWQACTVSGGSGTISIWVDPVNAVSVTCRTTASVGGTVSGLPAGASVTLSSNGATLPITANGVFAFDGLLATGSAYTVTVATQPAGRVCTVSNGTGTVVADVMAIVSVSCA